MSRGAMNCPFLMLTGLPVRAAATRRSVWRQRNAGIWSTSTTSAAMAACAGSWTSVRMASPVRALTSESTRSPASSPGPRNEPKEVRLALSYEALKMTGTPQRRAMSRTASAVSTVCAALSTTHGPTMNVNGAPSPTVMLPMVTRCTQLFYRNVRPPKGGHYFSTCTRSSTDAVLWR